MNKVDVELMIDNAATASQNGTLMGDPVTREAIRLNVIDPLMTRIQELQKENTDLMGARNENEKLRGQRDALMAERTSLIALRGDQLAALSAERDIWRGLALRGVE